MREIIIITSISIFIATFIPSMVMLGYWIDANNSLKNVEYGFVNVSDIEYRDLRTQKCIESHINYYVCCQSSRDYFIGICPLIEFTHDCRPIDQTHQPGDLCFYGTIGSYKQGWRNKCSNKVCDTYANLYNYCYVYTFNSKKYICCI